ncbi:MAG: peptidyl-prolyl cis-trans isomerase [Planctomycetes bacterium]|nr:peptidyl-prolyl cis-trans isomerase [Planctomycetota bacterium]
MVKLTIYFITAAICAICGAFVHAEEGMNSGKPPETGKELQERLEYFEQSNHKVAVINGEYVTYMDVRKRIEVAVRMYMQEDPVNYVQKANQLFANTVLELSRRKLLTQAADKEGISVSKEDVDELVNKKVKELNGYENFIEAIAQQGKTEQDVRKEFETDLKVRKLVLSRMGNIPKDSSASILKIDVYVSPQEIKDYYKANEGKFVDKKKAKMRYIVLKFTNDEEKKSARELGESIIRQLNDGVDFAALAKLYSDFKAEESGERDWIVVDTFFPEIRIKVEKMNVGEHSDLIETDGSYRIFKLEGITEERKKSFVESEDSIKIMLSNKKYEEALAEMCSHLLKGAVIWPEDLFSRNRKK